MGLSNAPAASLYASPAEPRPAGRSVVGMRWHDLLFVHWPVPAAALRIVLPAGVEPDVFGGSAWVAPAAAAGCAAGGSGTRAGRCGRRSC